MFFDGILIYFLVTTSILLFLSLMQFISMTIDLLGEISLKESIKISAKRTARWFIVSFLQLVSFGLLAIVAISIYSTLPDFENKNSILWFGAVVLVLFVLVSYLLYRFVKWKAPKDKPLAVAIVARLILLSPFYLIVYSIYYIFMTVYAILYMWFSSPEFKDKQAEEKYKKRMEDLDYYLFFNVW
ncbi:hypothetical protein [Sulfurimonas sp.]